MIDDGLWRGTTSAFITHWTEQIRMYDENIDAAGNYPAKVNGSS